MQCRRFGKATLPGPAPGFLARSRTIFLLLILVYLGASAVASQELDPRQRKLLAAYTALQSDQWEQAHANWSELARGGYAPAAVMMGAVYSIGLEGVIERDETLALQWFDKAEEEGLHSVHHAKILLARNNRLEEAAEILSAVAAEGDAYGMLTLGGLYDAGKVVERDLEQARSWYRRAAALGDPEAIFNLGHLAETEGPEPDLASVLEHYRRAAALGVPEAQFNLGRLYDQGSGVAKDPSRAAGLYLAAAKQGYGRAQIALGNLYEIGPSSFRNEVEAMFWYRVAAHQGFPEAQTNLGRMYELGKGSSRNPILASMWTEIARVFFGDPVAEEASRRLATLLPVAYLDVSQEMAYQWRPMSFEEALSHAGRLRKLDYALDRLARPAPRRLHDLGIEGSSLLQDVSGLRGPSGNMDPGALLELELAAGAAQVDSFELPDIDLSSDQLRDILEDMAIPHQCLVMDPPPPECPNHDPLLGSRAPIRTNPAEIPFFCLVTDPPPPECPNHDPSLDLPGNRPPVTMRINGLCLVMDPPPPGCPNHDSDNPWWTPSRRSLPATLPPHCLVMDPPPPECNNHGVDRPFGLLETLEDTSPTPSPTPDLFGEAAKKGQEGALKQVAKKVIGKVIGGPIVDFLFGNRMGDGELTPEATRRYDERERQRRMEQEERYERERESREERRRREQERRNQERQEQEERRRERTIRDIRSARPGEWSRVDDNPRGVARAGRIA